MHRRMIGAAMIVGLTSGLMGAVAYDQFVRPASADSGPPSGLSTREQNLDTNGLIRVHEQGTPTVSVGNFPVDANGNLKVAGSSNVSGTVNVGNFPATQPVSGTVNVGNLPVTQPVSGTVTVGNFPATQNVNVVGGTIAASGGAVTRGTADGLNVEAKQSNSFSNLILPINATTIVTGGCSFYDFFGPSGIDFHLQPNQVYSFSFAIPITLVQVHNNDLLFTCDASVSILGN